MPLVATVKRHRRRHRHRNRRSNGTFSSHVSGQKLVVENVDALEPKKTVSVLTTSETTHPMSKRTPVSLKSIEPKQVSTCSSELDSNYRPWTKAQPPSSEVLFFDRNSIRPFDPHHKSEAKEKERRRRRRRCFGFAACCPCCSPCCCLLCGIFIALLLAAIGALIFLLIPTNRTSTTVTTTTSTSSTSTTTTSATTSTSTSSTSTSTSSTSTSSTSTSTTSETTTTETTSTSTSTTTTSETTSTSTSTTTTTATTSTTTILTTTTVTTSTKTTTTATTTATITSNTCTSGWTGVTTLYHCGNCPDIMPYSFHSYTYVAIGTLTRLSFAFREDVGCFSVDNVSVRSTAAPGVELIANGGFETGSLSSWTYCNPSGASAAGAVFADVDSTPCISYTLQSQSGAYFYYDGAVGHNDYLSQKFNTVIGQTYTVSFWLYNEGGGGTSIADILLSI